MKEFTQESLFQTTEFEKNTDITPIHADMDGIDETETVTTGEHFHEWEHVGVEACWVVYGCKCGERTKMVNHSDALHNIRRLITESPFIK